LDVFEVGTNQFVANWRNLLVQQAIHERHRVVDIILQLFSRPGNDAIEVLAERIERMPPGIAFVCARIAEEFRRRRSRRFWFGIPAFPRLAECAQTQPARSKSFRFPHRDSRRFRCGGNIFNINLSPKDD
jgi:hypothetical protein